MDQSQSPFANIIAKMKTDMGGQGMMGGQPGQPQDASTGSMQDMASGEPVNQLLPNQTADNTQGLIGALSSMQKYIASSTNPQEIALARQIASLLTQLIAREHQKGLGNLAADQEALPNHQDLIKRAAMAKKVLG